MWMSDKNSTGTFKSPPATGGKAIGENWEQQNKKPDPFFIRWEQQNKKPDPFFIRCC